MVKTNVQNDVYIGSNATILPVEISSGTVIGAWAVVTKDIKFPGVCAGNPPKLLSKMKVPFVDLKKQYLNIKRNWYIYSKKY